MEVICNITNFDRVTSIGTWSSCQLLHMRFDRLCHSATYHPVHGNTAEHLGRGYRRVFPFLHRPTVPQGQQ